MQTECHDSKRHTLDRTACVHTRLMTMVETLRPITPPPTAVPRARDDDRLSNSPSMDSTSAVS